MDYYRDAMQRLAKQSAGSKVVLGPEKRGEEAELRNDWSREQERDETRGRSDSRDEGIEREELGIVFLQ